MTASPLLEEMKRQGVKLTAKGGRLFASPKEQLTPQLIASLKAQKHALLSLLEPKRSESDESCPNHWLHIQLLPPKAQQALTQNADGEGSRYRVNLFGQWYIIRFCPNISVDQIDVTCTASKHRPFADLNEFYRWAWAETLYTDLVFRSVN